jgi:hypothetical protein
MITATRGSSPAADSALTTPIRFESSQPTGAVSRYDDPVGLTTRAVHPRDSSSLHSSDAVDALAQVVVDDFIVEPITETSAEMRAVRIEHDNPARIGSSIVGEVLAEVLQQLNAAARALVGAVKRKHSKRNLSPPYESHIQWGFHTSHSALNPRAQKPLRAARTGSHFLDGRSRPSRLSVLGSSKARKERYLGSQVTVNGWWLEQRCSRRHGGDAIVRRALAGCTPGQAGHRSRRHGTVGLHARQPLPTWWTGRSAGVRRGVTTNG